MIIEHRVRFVIQWEHPRYPGDWSDHPISDRQYIYETERGAVMAIPRLRRTMERNWMIAPYEMRVVKRTFIEETV